jgi:hypothetical protein
MFGGARLTLRPGQFLTNDHGLSAIRLSFLGSDLFLAQKDFSASLFGSLQGHVVGRNIFLDGSTFDNDGLACTKASGRATKSCRPIG